MELLVYMRDQDQVCPVFGLYCFYNWKEEAIHNLLQTTPYHSIPQYRFKFRGTLNTRNSSTVMEHGNETAALAALQRRSARWGRSRVGF